MAIAGADVAAAIGNADFAGSQGSGVDGGHFDLGEMLVFNNIFDRTSMNNLGTHLSNKWDATWVDFE